MIKTLKANKQLIILNTDKNLGPAVMERDKYIKHILREHLNNPTYTQLSNEEYDKHMTQFMLTTFTYFEQHKANLSKTETKYFRQTLYDIQTTNNYRDAQFYGTPKVHKEMIPYIRFRPVVSQCGTFGARLSTYIDYILQTLTTAVYSYVKNSHEVIKNYNNMDHFHKTQKSSPRMQNPCIQI